MINSKLGTYPGIVTGGAASGKTSTLLAQLLWYPKTVLIVLNEERREHCLSLLNASFHCSIKNVKDRIISFSKSNENLIRHLPRDTEIMVDDMEDLLEKIFGHPVRTFSVTKDR